MTNHNNAEWISFLPIGGTGSWLLITSTRDSFYSNMPSNILISATLSALKLLEDITSDTEEKAPKDLNSSNQTDHTTEQQIVEEVNSNLNALYYI